MILRTFVTILATLGVIDSAIAGTEEPKNLQTVPLNTLTNEQIENLFQKLPAEVTEQIINQGFIIYDSTKGVIRANAGEIEIEDGVHYKFTQTMPCGS